MYEAFFGLSTRPFADRPDPEFFFESESHAAALGALYDGLQTQQPILVITGETGCGKTMLARAMLRGIEAGPVTVGVINNPHTSVRDLTRWTLLSFGQETAGRTDAELREALALYFVSEYGAGRRCLLVIDEAQNLTAEALAGLHEYLDLNAEGDCLLQIVLVAAPRLLQTMRDPVLATWTERLPQICLVGPLGLAEVPRYIRARLAAAGAGRELFTDRAVAAVSAASGGVPRLVSAICDMALVYAFARGRGLIDHDVVADVVSEGQAAGLGSLGRIASGEASAETGRPGPIAEPLPPEPVARMEAADDNALAPFVESQILAAPEPILRPLQTAAASSPTAAVIADMGPAQVEFFPAEPGALFEVDFVPPEPATVPSRVDQAEAPALSAMLQPAPRASEPPPPAAQTAGIGGWPSIARNGKLTRSDREGTSNVRAASGRVPLRRRFLPRD